MSNVRLAIVKLGRWLAGSGLSAEAAYLTAAEVAGHKTPNWPYWLFGAITIVGLAVLLGSWLWRMQQPGAAPDRMGTDAQESGRQTHVTGGSVASMGERSQAVVHNAGIMVTGDQHSLTVNDLSGVPAAENQVAQRHRTLWHWRILHKEKM